MAATPIPVIPGSELGIPVEQCVNTGAVPHDDSTSMDSGAQGSSGNVATSASLSVNKYLRSCAHGKFFFLLSS